MKINKDNLKKLSLEDYNQLLTLILEEQEERFGDDLKNSTYHGEMPILPIYQVSRVPIEFWRPFEGKGNCILC